MDTSFLNIVNEGVLSLMLLGLLLGAIEIGFRLGGKFEARFNEKSKSHVSTIAASLLGLLGLLLGFTLSMSVTRFELRKQLVLDEANAIRRAYLRTKLMSVPEGTEIGSLLAEFVETRLRSVDPTNELKEIEAGRAEEQRLQGELWDRAVTYAKKDANMIPTGLLLQSLTEVIDIGAERWTQYNNHVPPTVIYADRLVAFLALILIGYALGFGRQRQFLPTCMLALAIAIVLAVILDLDNPQRGLIHVSQQPMIELKQQLSP